MSATRAGAARAAFDASFASPLPVADEPGVRLLMVRMGSERFAVRLAELAGLHQGRRVVPVPAPAPALLGLVGLRGRLWPVFSLARLLGHGDDGEPRWLLACAGGREPFALGVAHLEGYRELSPADLCAAASESADTGAHVRGAARLQGAVVPIVSIASIVNAIEKKEL